MMNFKEWLQKDELPADLAPGEYMDSMGVRVKDTSVAKGIDAGIADLIERINTAGFKTIQSMSGLKRDYPYGDRYSNNGYIAFMKSDLKPGQEEKIKEAAKAANLPCYDSNIFFHPAVVVRTEITKSGDHGKSLLKQAGQQAMDSMNLPPEEVEPERDSVYFPGEKHGPRPRNQDKFFKWLDIRDKINKEMADKAGGWIEDAEIEKRWKLFGNILTQG